MGDTILEGNRQPHTISLWDIDIPSQLHQANSAITTPSAKPADLVTFAHAALFSPVLSTLQTALKKQYLTNLPGLTSITLNKYPPNSLATAKGHLNQLRQGIQSTKQDPDPLPLLLPELHEDMYPASDTDNHKTHACYAAIIQPTGKTFSDQTGRFIIPSSNGNNYCFILYDYDSNSIHAEPMKTKSTKEHIKAYSTVHDRLVRAGLRPKLHMLDNECSKQLQNHITDSGTKLQTTPAGVHRRNAAERAIQTFKNHLIAGLCSTDPNFPLHLWDRLLEQCEVTLNLLRGSRINPALSAYAQVHGHFDFLATPIAPPGIHVVVHEKTKDRDTWSPKGKDGWYIGPALDSYRCYKTWIWETQRERKADTLAWFPTHLQMPFASTSDLIIAGVNDIAKAIQNPPLSSQPIPLQPNEIATLKDLTQILTNRTVTPETKPTAPVLRVEKSPDTYLEANTHSKRQSRRQQKKTLRYEHYKKELDQQAAKKQLATKDAAWFCSQLEIDPTHLHQSNKAVHPDTGKLADYKALSQSSDGHHWRNSCSDEIGRLAQGRHPTMPTGTETIHFIHKHQMPPNRTATYLRIVSTDRPQKKETRRVRFTVGGDKIDYPFDVSTKTAALLTVKILLNSVISTPNAKFMTIDIKDFYLNTPMDRYEYMRIPFDIIPDDIVQQYNLKDLVHNGYIYAEIRKGMYGLPQAGRIANDELVPYLAQHGYHQSKHTHGLFRHATRPVAFSLIVDDFGVKYEGEENAKHLVNTLANKYTITQDWSGALYCGISLKWDYTNRTVDLSMPGYIDKALQRFQHPKPTKPEDAPHAWIAPNYGAPIQYTAAEDNSEPLNPKGIKRLQEIVGVLLYYARAVDNTMLVALNDISAAQTKGTAHTAEAVTKLLNYAASHPNATVRFTISQMILHVHSDGSYLSAPKARSRAGGFHYLSNGDIDNPQANGPIHVTAKIMKNVLSSAAECEVGAAFNNAQEACPMRTILEELGHKQPPTPIQTDNACAEGILKGTVKQKRSKAIDMRFYWLKDRIDQGQFHIYWKPGATNLADYASKHHSPAHHRRMRPIYLHEEGPTTIGSNPNNNNKQQANTCIQSCEGVLI